MKNTPSPRARRIRAMNRVRARLVSAYTLARKACAKSIGDEGLGLLDQAITEVECALINAYREQRAELT